MKASEVGFRDVYHKICYITAGKNYNIMTKEMPNSTKGTGVIAYGYVDHQAGLSFEVLACAKRNNDGSFEVFEGNDSILVKYRFSSIKDCELYFVSEELKSEFTDKIQMIDKHYSVNDNVLATRELALIDECRNREYPDDVLVVFVRGDNRPEGCWVRCEALMEGKIVGILLNEPDADFTVHAGDKIEFGIMEKEAGIMCVAVLDER